MLRGRPPESHPFPLLVIAPALSRVQPERDTGCDNASVTAPQSRDGSGRWPRGVSGNPGGRPQGLARATRDLVGEDGMKLAAFWLSIMDDTMRRDSGPA